MFVFAFITVIIGSLVMGTILGIFVADEYHLRHGNFKEGFDPFEKRQKNYTQQRIPKIKRQTSGIRKRCTK
jgi:hypothetical protein